MNIPNCTKKFKVADSKVHTARGYGFGQSEKNLGYALGEHQLGKDAVVCTKISCDAIAEQGVEALVNESLRNLRRDSVDIVLLHNPPDAEVVKVMVSPIHS